MFKDEYQNEICKIKPSQKLIDATCAAVLADMEAQEERETRPQRKLPLFRSAVALATVAAVFCLVMFGTTLLNPQTDNVFSIKAYAMEQQTDGSVELREVDLINQDHIWSGYNDGENIYLNVRLKCEGENIKSVDFFTDEGFFAKQYIKMENGKIVTDNVPISYVGDSHTLVMYGTDFEIVGSKLTLEKDVMTDDLLLFLGSSINGRMPLTMTIRALATFNDGKTQEETLMIDFPGELVIVNVVTRERFEAIQSGKEKKESYDYVKIHNWRNPDATGESGVFIEADSKFHIFDAEFLTLHPVDDGAIQEDDGVNIEITGEEE
ncbi:hypothetical protein FACS1894127_2160 [Clostridia bacterium]|nr:hypothetical protein FACS1894127_2160 [Clostridia bacterium]